MQQRANGARIRAIRTERGMTREQLAVRARISVRSLQSIEGDAQEPRTLTLESIAKVLGVKVDELTTEDDEAVSA